MEDVNICKECDAAGFTVTLDIFGDCELCTPRARPDYIDDDPRDDSVADDYDEVAR